MEVIKIIKFLSFYLILLNSITNVFCDDCDEKSVTFQEYADCCHFPDEPELNMKFLTECVQELQIDEKTAESMNDTVECMLTECLFKKERVVDADGKILKVEAKRYVAELFKDAPNWIPLITESTEKCIDQGMPLEEEIRKRSSEPPYNIPIEACNVMNGYYMTCASVHLLVNCPDNQKVYSEKCDAGRKYLNDCPDQFLSSAKDLD